MGVDVLTDPAVSDAVKAAITKMDPAQKRALDKIIIGSSRFKSRYKNDYPAFIADCFRWEPGDGATDYQNEIAEQWTDDSRDCIRAPHGVGKSTLAAWRLIGFALICDGECDWKAITTAGVWRQLEKYLWPEIHKWIGRIRWDRVDRKPFDRRSELLTLKLQLRANGHAGSAFPVASDNAAFIEGAHADRILYVFDESKTIPPETWDAAEGAFGGEKGHACALAISTPGEPHGRFYDIQTRKAGYEDWTAYHITLEQAIKAGRIARAWADQRLLQWGENSPMYQNRVLGNFAQQTQDSIIPLAWVEMANERWLEMSARGFGVTERLGIDVSDGGEDNSVITPRVGNAIKSVDVMPRADDPVMHVTGVAAAIMRATNCDAVVDSIGVGAGCVQRLREQTYDNGQRLRVVAFNAAAATDMRDRSGEMGFVNCRAAAWWNLREMLDPSNGEDVALPPNDLLTGDLCAVRYRVASGGKIQAESKDELRKPSRLGRSTDYGDPVVQAFWTERVRLEHWGADDFESTVLTSAANNDLPPLGDF